MDRKKGFVAWNRGLTKKTDKRVMKYARKRSKIMKEKWKDPNYREQMKNSISLGVYGENNPFYGKRHTEEFKKRLSEERKGKVMFKSKEQMKIGTQRVKEDILSITSELTGRGFRCAPLHHGLPVPDIIAIKDGKVYAVEVFSKAPQKDKYNDYPFCDDVIWIDLRRNLQKQIDDAVQELLNQADKLKEEYKKPQ